jgi:hypothetical protein
MKRRVSTPIFHVFAALVVIAGCGYYRWWAFTESSESPAKRELQNWTMLVIVERLVEHGPADSTAGFSLTIEADNKRKDTNIVLGLDSVTLVVFYPKRSEPSERTVLFSLEAETALKVRRIWAREDLAPFNQFPDSIQCTVHCRLKWMNTGRTETLALPYTLHFQEQRRMWIGV